MGKCIISSAIVFSLLITALIVNAGPNTRIIFDAFNPSSTSFVYCDTSDPQGLTCTTGSAADDGWFGIRGLDRKHVIIRPDIVSLTSGNIEFTTEARTEDRDGNWITATLIAPIQFTAAQTGLDTSIFEDYDQLRVGVRINGVDDAVDDSITVHFDGGQ